jgi:hypothetical protein
MIRRFLQVRDETIFNLEVTIVAVVLGVSVLAGMNFNSMSASVQTMMPGNQTSFAKTMAGSNMTSPVPVPTPSIRVQPEINRCRNKINLDCCHQSLSLFKVGISNQEESFCKIQP